MRPVLRLKISVRRPERGWHAAFAMRYADASQERRERELKDVEMLAERVAMMVESTAPRKTPTQIAPKVMTSFLVLGSFWMIIASADGDAEGP